MEFLGQVIAWLTDAAHWSGADGVPVRVAEHLTLSVIPLVIAVAIALPIGAWVGHTGRGADLAVNVANIGRAIPSLAILAIAAQLLNPTLVDLGLRREAAEITTIVAMLALAMPPILTNAYIGVSEVDPELVEAGRGMGMRDRDVLRKVELPVALPVMLAGIRTAAVNVVATATLGAVFGTGGLGRFIIDGIAQRTYEEVFAGALLVAGLSMITELTFAFVQARAVSPGLRRRVPEAWLEPAQAPRAGGGIT